MNTRIIHEGESFNRAVIFANTNSADIPTTSKGSGYVTTLGGIYSQLLNAGALQKPISVAAQNALILALDKKLGNMATTAQAYAAIEPGFDDLFPRCSNFSPGAVLQTAKSYLAKLAPAQDDDAATTAAKAARVKVFVDHGMASTLVADLQQDLTNIGTVSTTREESREQGVLSTAQVEQLVTQGRIQRELLGAIFHVVYANRPDKLAAWVSASHVEAASHHKAAPAPTPVPTTATK